MVARSAKTASTAESKTRTRPQLDVATIMDAALRLSAAGNPEPLTVRSLGKELGADPTAIYRHFRDKDELVRAVLDQLISDVVAAVDPDAGWRDRLTELANESLDVFCAHPSIGSLAGSQTTGGQGELAAIEMIVGPDVIPTVARPSERKMTRFWFSLAGASPRSANPAVRPS